MIEKVYFECQWSAPGIADLYLSSNVEVEIFETSYEYQGVDGIKKGYSIDVDDMDIEFCIPETAWLAPGMRDAISNLGQNIHLNYKELRNYMLSEFSSSEVLREVLERNGVI